MFELYRPAESALHRLDARVKLLMALGYILALSLTPPGAWPAYLLFFSLAFAAALLSRLGSGFALKRALLAAPFVLAALPLIFTGPEPHLPLWSGARLAYSPAGLERFASIAVKSWLSVQAAVLLAATTRFADLLTALKQLRTPRLFVTIITLMWRYLFVIGEEARRLLRARASRSASAAGRRPGGNLPWRARVTGGLAGSLLLRSLERSDRVYAAMLSRGYNGEPPGYETRALSAGDRRTLRLGALLLALVWLLGLLTGG